jgi:hypothetical protein
MQELNELFRWYKQQYLVMRVVVWVSATVMFVVVVLWVTK